MKYVYESYTITQYNYLLDSQDGRPSRYKQSCQHYTMLCAHTRIYVIMYMLDYVDVNNTIQWYQ
jgi:hypothetical protein